MMSNKFLLLFSLSIIWGANFPISKFLLTNMSPVVLRFTSGLLSLVIYSIIIGFSLKRWSPISRKEWGRILLLSIPSVFLVPLLNLVALDYLTSSSALILIYTMPAFTTLILVTINLSISTKQLISIMLCISGVLCLVWNEMSFGLGEMTILMSALLWALGGLLNQNYCPRIPMFQICLIQLVFVSILNIIVLMFFHSFSEVANLSLNYKEWMALLFVGTFAGGIAIFIWMLLIERYGAEVAAYSTLLAPILGLIIIAFIADESLTLPILLGGFLVLSSVALKLYTPPLKN